MAIEVTASSSRSVEIPGYELVSLLGRGGMAEVYLANHAELDRQVALKLMRSDGTSDRALARFRREAEVMHRIRHAHLLRLFDFGHTDDRLWMALELIRGAPLDQVIQAHGPLPPEQAKAIMVPLAEALDALHAEGVVHRDVKPGNIMLEDGGRPVLMDLGLVRTSELTALTQTGSVVGTPVYMSPEALTGHGWESDLDWYAWAMTWWECLVGRRPFELDRLFEYLREGVSPEVAVPVSPHGPIEAADVATILRCLGPREQRPGRLADIRRALEETVEWEEADTRSLTAMAITSGEAATTVKPPLLPRWLQQTMMGFGFLVLVLVARKFWLASSLPTGEDDSVAVQVLTTYRNRHGFLLEGKVPQPSGLRAYTYRGGRRVPAPVYAMEEKRFLVWITGLGPGAKARVELEESPGEVSLEVLGAALAMDEPEPEQRYPGIFRPLWGGHPGDTEARELAELRAVVDQPELFRDEVTHSFSIPPFSHVPRRWWPVMLAWMEEGDVLGANLLNVMRWAATPIPPVVSWHLLHRQADPESALNVQVADHTDVEYTPVRESDLPPAAYALIEEWVADHPQYRRGLYRLLVRLGKLRWGATGHTSFPLVVPGWRDREQGASPEASLSVVLSGLIELAARVETGDEAAFRELKEHSEGEGLEGEMATVLLPVTRRKEVVPELMERFRTASGSNLEALDAALWGFRSPTGFTASTEEELLFRRTFREFEVERVDSPTGANVVFRPEIAILYGLYERDGHEVRFHGTRGELRRFRVKAVSGHRPIEEAPDGREP